METWISSAILAYAVVGGAVLLGYRKRLNSHFGRIMDRQGITKMRGLVNTLYAVIAQLLWPLTIRVLLTKSDIPKSDQS